MTSLLVVSRPELSAPIRTLLGALPGVNLRMASSLDGLPWQDADCLWIHDLRVIPPELDRWIAAGGRLLATLQAAAVPVALGIESIPPDDERDTLWTSSHEAPPNLGLAAFGSHPLFDGLQRAALTWRPGESEPYHSITYHTARPREGRVVAVQWDGVEVDPHRVMAWEYQVGLGGMLCIGAGVHPSDLYPGGPLHLRTVLRNALVGSGIPSSARQGESRHWPRPGTTVGRADLGAVPALPPLVGEWSEDETDAGATGHEPGDAPSCRVAGRRVAIMGSSAGGLEEVWCHPCRVVRETLLRVDRLPTAEGWTVELSGGAARHTRAGEVAVRERWLAALEHPVWYWEVVPDLSAPVQLEWTTDLRRAWPDPAGGLGDLTLVVAPDGRRAAVGATGDPFQLVVDLEGGTLEAAPLPGPAIRFSVLAPGRCRLRFTAAADAADLERSRQFLARRDLEGVRRQRADHAAELASFATSIEAPDPGIVDGFEWAKIRMDSHLASSPGVGRSILAGASEAEDRDVRPGARFGGPEACQIALAQLAAGDRSGARDVLKFLSVTQDADGAILGECAASGVGRHGPDGPVIAFLQLTAGYAAWTGELDFLARRWSSIRRALELGFGPGSPSPAWSATMAAMQPVAEALGHVELAQALEERSGQGMAGWPSPAAEGESFGVEQMRVLADRVRARADRPRLAAEFASMAIEGWWGVRPDALAGAVRLAPRLPPEWDAMALDRLRVGRTVLRVRVRRRFGTTTMLVERVHGPRIFVEASVRGLPEGAVAEVDGVPLGAARASFEADGSHTLVWNS